MTDIPLDRAGIQALTDDTGTFAMLALDQRESMRMMMAAGSGQETISDSQLSDFKLLATSVLSPLATAVLLDRSFGLAAAAESSCPVILAADILHQGPGGGVTGSSLDPGVTPALVADIGAHALKLLVSWVPDDRADAVRLAGSFMTLCQKAGVPGIVEGVVRPADIANWSDEDRNLALVTAAEDFAAVSPDLYKTEVPFYGKADAASIRDASQRITDAIGDQWVVLSSGVRADDFPSAVQACVGGGASGFLAGRAIWADSLAAPDTEDFLRTTSRRRLIDITELARGAR